MRFLCSYPNTYEYMGVTYATVDLSFVCGVADLHVAGVSNREVAQVLFVPPQDVDITKFAFPSVGKIVERYRVVSS
jgi:hypothetical protein